MSLGQTTPRPETTELRCEHDEGTSYWGGCEARARYRIKRPGDGYAPGTYCPAHVGDALAYMADGEDVPLIVHVLFDEPEEHSTNV